MNAITSPACSYESLRLRRWLLQRFVEYKVPAHRLNDLRIVDKFWMQCSFPLRSLALLFLAISLGTLTFGQTQDVAVAKVNGRPITQKEVDRLVIAQTLPLEEKLYAIRKAALENLITSRVLEDEAKKRGILVGELRKQLAAGEVEVTSNEVETAYAENASFFASMSPDEAKERLRMDLANQKRMQNYRVALTKLRHAANIDLLLVEPRLPAGSGDSYAPSVGPVGAIVTVVEYSDFECPYCRQVEPFIKQILATYGQKLRLVFKYLPLQIHENSFVAAQAAFCAGRQGRFWQFHDALFAGTFASSNFLNKTAANLRLDISSFNDCLNSDAAKAAVRADIREANQLGINSTPTFIINGKLVRGAISFEEFKAFVERELKTAQNSSRP